MVMHVVVIWPLPDQTSPSCAGESAVDVRSLYRDARGSYHRPRQTLSRSPPTEGRWLFSLYFVTPVSTDL